MNKRLFVTGIGTGVGKTVTAAILAAYLGADYWKPLQCGDLQCSDSSTVRQLAGKPLHIFPERYRFELPAAPLEAAAAEGVSVRLHDFSLPETQRPLIVEGAGGLFVPLNEQDFIIDLIAWLQLPVVLVVRDYLGCINHTLLSVRALQYRGIPIACLVFNGAFNPVTKASIARHIPAWTEVIQLPELAQPDQAHVAAAVTALENIKRSAYA